MAATREKPATVLVVNTLTSKPGEAPHAFLRRNGLDTHLLQDTQLALFPECGVPHADRHDRFNGVTMAALELRVPEGHDVPLQNGLACSPRGDAWFPERFSTNVSARSATRAWNSPNRSQRLAQVGPCHRYNFWTA